MKSNELRLKTTRDINFTDGTTLPAGAKVTIIRELQHEPNMKRVYVYGQEQALGKAHVTCNINAEDLTPISPSA